MPKNPSPPPTADADYSDIAPDPRAPGIEVFEDQAGGWRFRLKASNGEVVATSEAYTRREDVERGFGDLIDAALRALVVPPISIRGIDRERLALFANGAILALARDDGDLDADTEAKVIGGIVSAAATVVLSLEASAAAIASILDDRLPGESA